MTNELELRLECMKLAVEITPASMYPQTDKILANADMILKYITNDSEVTFDSLKEKETSEVMENIFGIIPVFIELFNKISSKPEDMEPAQTELKTAKKTKKQEDAV